MSSVVKHVSATEVEYNCVKGYKLDGGNRSRVCTTSGMWSGKTPRCIGKELKLLFTLEMNASEARSGL